MATDEGADGQRRTRRRRTSSSDLEDGKIYKSRGKEEIKLEPNVSEIRRIRLERLESSTSTHRSVATPKMTSESHAILPSLKSPSSRRRKHDSRRSTLSTKHRTKRQSTSKDDSPPSYVYGTPADNSQSSRITITGTSKLGRDERSSESGDDEEDRTTVPDSIQQKHKTRKIRVIYVKDEEIKSSKHKGRRVKSDGTIRDRRSNSYESIGRSRGHTTRRKSVAEDPPASTRKRYFFLNHDYLLLILTILLTEVLQQETYRLRQDRVSEGATPQRRMYQRSSPTMIRL